MPVAYRSVFTILGNQKKTEDLIFEQFNEWLMKDPVRNPRKLNRDLYKINAITIFNSKTELIYFDHKTNDGSRTLRARLIEDKIDDQILMNLKRDLLDLAPYKNQCQIGNFCFPFTIKIPESSP
jgi:hypothetical protein